jgi:nucleoside-diphosphate-sugar epimerase
MQPENVLISGINGFIGKHLSKTFRSYADVSSSFKSEDVLIDERGIDILNLEQLKRRKTNPDLIIHLAAKTSIEKSLLFPYDTYYTNVLGTLNLLELARIKGVPNFVYVSTYVYGHPKSLPINEGHPIAPHSPYNKSKVLGEELCRNFSFDYGINVVNLRLFSVYGPNCRSGSFIGSIISQINRTGKAILTARGIKRDFLFIDDLVNLISLIAQKFPRGYNIYNVGSGKSYSLEYISSLIAPLLKKSLFIEYKDEAGAPVIYDIVADISKVSDTFHWTPFTKIKDGVELTVNSNQ